MSEDVPKIVISDTFLIPSIHSLLTFIEPLLDLAAALNLSTQASLAYLGSPTLSGLNSTARTTPSIASHKGDSINSIRNGEGKGKKQIDENVLSFMNMATG